MKKKRPEYYELKPLADVNITPLVDVTFFILIIFILIAPLIEHGINVNLPTASAKKLEQKDSITISVRKTESGPRIYLEKERLTLDELGDKLKTVAASQPDISLLLRADKDLDYNTVIQVVDRVTDAGIAKLGMATMAEDKNQP
jgi:biopolymer transport protein TolR